MLINLYEAWFTVSNPRPQFFKVNHGL
uniref:Uncharacterized protein n=1 Tax=Rhizophora mucronata TaxID=61149 RepID=A0A2P2N5T8_RHIMU